MIFGPHGFSGWRGDSPLVGTHLAATAATATGLKLQEWGLLKAKLREKEGNLREFPPLSLSSRGYSSQP